MASAYGSFGLTSTPTRVASGTSSCKELQPLGRQLDVNQLTPVTLPPGRLRLATRPMLDWVERRSTKTIGISLSLPLRPAPRRRTARCDNDSDLPAHQLGRQCRQPSSSSSLGPAIFDRDVPALDIAHFAQSLTECRHEHLRWPSAIPSRKPITGTCRLLRARRERPRRRRAAEQRDELAAL